MYTYRFFMKNTYKTKHFEYEKKKCMNCIDKKNSLKHNISFVQYFFKDCIVQNLSKKVI